MGKIRYDEVSHEPYIVHKGTKYALRVLDRGYICCQPVSGSFSFWEHLSDLPEAVQKVIREYNG